MSVHVDVGAGYGQAGMPRGVSCRNDVGNSRAHSASRRRA